MTRVPVRVDATLKREATAVAQTVAANQTYGYGLGSVSDRRSVSTNPSSNNERVIQYQ